MVKPRQLPEVSEKTWRSSSASLSATTAEATSTAPFLPPAQDIRKRALSCALVGALKYLPERVVSSVKMVEAGGIEPPSETRLTWVSTSVAPTTFLASRPRRGRV